MATKPPGKLAVNSPRGALYCPVHANREVIVYPIQEHELKTLSVLNSQMSLWCSIGTSSVTLLVSCLWDVINDSGNAIFSRQCISFMVACLALAGMSFLLAWRFRAERNQELIKIKSEVVSQDVSASA